MRLALPAVLAVALAFAAPASAKELKRAQVCGAGDECAQLDDRQSAEGITNFGSPTQPPPSAPYFRVDFVYESAGGHDHNAFSHLYVPSKNLIAAGGPRPDTIAWFRIGGSGLALLHRATADLEPYAAPPTWPTSIDDPMFAPAPSGGAPPAPDGRSEWAPWVVAAMLFAVAVGAGAFLARRLRLRRPKTAGA